MVAKNLHFGCDELDILAISPDEKVLAIVEVRSTMNESKMPERSISKKKRFAMLRVAKRLLATAKKHSCELRVDVIAVRLKDEKPSISHYEGVFRL